MTNQTENPDVGTPDSEALLVAYSELCTSYNAIREFRAKLLGFLPLASAGGVFLLLNTGGDALRPLTFIMVGVLGCLITVGLYLYEQHNMDRCHRLIYLGAEWEEKGLHLHNGQFMMRVQNKQVGSVVGGSRFKLAAAMIYGAVFLGWFYVILMGLFRGFASGEAWLALF